MWWTIGLAVVLIALWVWGRGSGSDFSRSRSENGASSDWNPRNELKEATALKKAGKLDEACDFLLDLLGRWEADPPRLTDASVAEDYPEVTHYWKAANYLQRADRSDEAEQVLNRLLDGEYPRIKRHREYYRTLEREGPDHPSDQHRIENLLKKQPEDTIYMDLTRIHDKARLFLEREGRDREAAKHGVLSYASGVLSLWYGSRGEPIVQERFEEQTSDEWIRDAAGAFAERMERADLEESVVQELAGWIETIPDASLRDLENRIEAVLKNA